MKWKCLSNIKIILNKLPFFIDMLGDQNMNIETSIISIGYINLGIPRPPVRNRQSSIIIIESSSKR